jgi:hypothetical protein
MGRDRARVLLLHVGHSRVEIEQSDVAWTLTRAS